MKRYIREILNDVQAAKATEVLRNGQAGVDRPSNTERRAPVADGKFPQRSSDNS